MFNCGQSNVFLFLIIILLLLSLALVIVQATIKTKSSHHEPYQSSYHQPSHRQQSYYQPQHHQPGSFMGGEGTNILSAIVNKS